MRSNSALGRFWGLNTLAAAAMVALAAPAMATSVYTVETFAVTDDSEDDAISLREVLLALESGEAYNEAPAPDPSGMITINLPAGFYFLSDPLPTVSRSIRLVGDDTRADLQGPDRNVSRSIRLVGDDTGTVLIRSFNTYDFRLLTLEGSEAFEIEGIRFENGYHADDVYARGGAILHDGYGPLTITNCLFLDNTAFNTALEKVAGGAVYTSSDQLVITDSYFNSNSVISENIGVKKNPLLKPVNEITAQGGSLYVGGYLSAEPRYVNITNTKFEDSFAEVYDTISDVTGFAVYIEGGELYAYVDASKFIRNIGGIGDARDYISGGTLAVYTDSESSQFILDRTQFFANRGRFDGELGPSMSGPMAS
jgi:hypothetical protein